jgi:23S rRNA (cytosine1962-C5)-methyltransferase
MVRHDVYALLDCGDGRRLDAFGPFIIDRPAPGASEPRRTPDRWAGAAIYHRGSGWWAADGTPLAEVGYPVGIAGVTMEARLAPSGQIGLFPEHATNAEWIAAAVRNRQTGSDAGEDLPEVLNLFAYTGLATLVAARAGGRVTHVDASRPSIPWARRNAELSGLTDAPVRWIVDEALAFVRREARRGRRYAGLILDPPSYGHGTRGRGAGAWRFDELVDDLLEACAGIAEPDAFWLLTAHTPGWDPLRLAATLRAATDAPVHELESVALDLTAESGAGLHLGAAVRLDPLRGDRR